jgi:hypothetical protein
VLEAGTTVEERRFSAAIKDPRALARGRAKKSILVPLRTYFSFWQTWIDHSYDLPFPPVTNPDSPPVVIRERLFPTRRIYATGIKLVNTKENPAF